MKSVLIILVTLFSLNTYAENESWYFNLGIGSSKDTYPDALQTQIDNLSDLGVDISLMVDFGFYWPVFSESTMLGFSMSGNRYSASTMAGDVSIQTNLYALSVAHFFGSSVGSGLFLRADIGAARGVTEGSGLTVVSEWGSGFNVEAGWGIPISSGTRLLLSLYMNQKRIEGFKYKYTGFKICFLF